MGNIASKPDERDRKIEKYRERTGRKFHRSLDPKSYHLAKERGKNPLVDAVNAVMDRERRRKLN